MYLLRASTVKKIVRFLQCDILKYLILGTLIRHLVLPVPRFLNQNYPTCTKREGKRHIPVVYVFIVIYLHPAPKDEGIYTVGSPIIV